MITFLAMGDLPYSKEQSEIINKKLRPKIKKKDYDFLIHVGDFKAGGESCTNELILKRKKQIHKILPKKLIYTPGDNDWTDCDRNKLDVPLSELNRLQFLRDNFFIYKKRFVKKNKLVQQDIFPENSLWKKSKVVFGTLHVVGTNNGRRQIYKDDLRLTLSLVEARDNANRLWLNKIFEQAKLIEAKAVVLAMHADIFEPEHFEKHNGDCNVDQKKGRCDGFLHLRQQLKDLAAKFSKPVLLIHGDTNPYCMDQPYKKDGVTNLWRLNAPGDYNEIDLAKIVYDPSQNFPFQVKTILSDKAAPYQCVYKED
jgi:predicted phosphodiesterase